jgi:hypothetical protein
MKTMKCRIWKCGSLLVLAVLSGVSFARGQSVAVTLRLDTNQVAIGATTTLHVYAQVMPTLRSDAERIFSWYVDVLNTNGPVARGNYAAMLRPASDKDPRTSSPGLDQGANRRGIYDTFLNLPGAGVSNAVELMSIPVSGLAAGRTRFLGAAGSGVPSLSTDFLVSLRSGGAAAGGGDYSGAFADLEVVGASACPVRLQIAPAANNRMQLTFTPCPGRDHFVETATAPGNPAGWQTLAGAPQNSGVVFVTNSLPSSFFRVRVP